MFTINKVTRRFNEEYALRDVSFTIKGGMNFIIGASGSGKTTLLRIISGMDHEFEGEVYYHSTSIKHLTNEERCELYAHKFGFISQSFNLVDNLTVVDNLMIAGHLQPQVDHQSVIKVLDTVDMAKFAKQKVKKLSGGQKQRVAIARELLKNPEVLIADEPTAALDHASAKTVIEILRKLSHERTVIVVTHDTSLIDNQAAVYELDHGQLVKIVTNQAKSAGPMKAATKPVLTVGHAMQCASTNNLRNKTRFTALMSAIIISACCLLVNFNGVISGSSKRMFDQLFKTYGDSILDMVIADKFQSAVDDKSNSNSVTQDINGLYDKYRQDPRVEHVVFMESVTDQKITIKDQEYQVPNTYMAPLLNKLVAGRMPNGDQPEVVLSEVFVKRTGMKYEDIIGQEITLQGLIANKSGKEVTLDPVQIKLLVVGVGDTQQTTEEGGDVYAYTFEDAIFFSYSALANMRNQVGMTMKDTPFTIRAKSPKEMLAIKDELMKDGVVPIGRFQLIEGIMRINQSSDKESGLAYVVIGVLGMMASLAVAALSGLFRRKEYAIYQINGYSAGNLFKIVLLEYAQIALLAGMILAGVGVLYNLLLQTLLKTTFVTWPLFAVAMLSVMGVALLCAMVTGWIAGSTDASKALRTGDR